MASSGDMDDKVLIKFAQKLAGNEKKYRDRALKKLKKWLQSRANSPKGSFTKEDFLKIWKGLHYCMWMADKPLVQEELANSLSQLIHGFTEFSQSLLFFDTFLQTEAREWNGIDKLRLDKFMMLIRRCLAQCFQCVCRHGWQSAHVDQLCAVLSSGVAAAQDNDFPHGLKSHIADVFIEELEKAHSDQLTAEHVHKFLDVYAAFLYKAKSKQLCRHVIKHVFFYVIDTAVQRIEEQEVSPDEEKDDEEEESAQLQIDYESIADSLFEYASREDCVSNNRKDIYSLVKSLQNLQQGILPAEDQLSSESEDEDLDKALLRLQKFEKTVSNKSKRGKLAKKNKQKRKAAQLESPDDQPPKKKKKKSSNDTEEDVSQVTRKKSTNKFKKDKRSKKLATAKSAVFSENTTDDVGDTDMVADSSDACNSIVPVVENDTPAAVAGKKKKKKKKKKTLSVSENGVGGSPNEAGVEAGHEPLRDSDVTSCDIPSDTVSSLKPGKKGKRTSLDVTNESNHLTKKEKKKRRTIDNSELGQKTKKITENSPSDFVAIKNKKKGKCQMPPDNEVVENGEVEIFIPNKKYKGPLKGQLELKAKKARKAEKFASFQKSATPPAFVKKAFLKAKGGTMTDPQKRGKKNLPINTNPGSEPSKKRVSFIMANNTAQEFRESLNVSPVVPFNPTMLPESGILKSPSPVTNPKKKLLFKKRAKAADFF